ncbi:MAG TPA: GGDEF domain-containing protein [Bryobacteraceae bacterium]|nr:GGDEF domain-containing protein [Bryobacteraceae bacterium]
MVSIGESLAALEKCNREREFVVECYTDAIRAVAHYTIEVNPALLEPLRKYLNDLADEAASGKRETLCETRATFRGLLRSYRDKASEYLNRLRAELDSTAQAFEQIVGSFSQADGEHESRLRAALARLRNVARSPEGSGVRAALMSATDEISDCVEQIRKQNHFTVSQLKVEMGMLHKRIDSLEAAASVDQLTELYTRREIEERVRSEPGAYRLILFKVSGIRLAEVQFRAEVAAELTAAFTKRLRNSLPPNAIVGRWGPEEFVAMLSASVPEATAIAKSIAEQLSGPYACLLAGKTVRPKLQVNLGMVDSDGAGPDRILQRIAAFLTSG